MNRLEKLYECINMAELISSEYVILKLKRLELKYQYLLLEDKDYEIFDEIRDKLFPNEPKRRIRN